MSNISFSKDQRIAFDGDSLTYLRSGPCNDQWPWLRISNSHRSWADVMSELLFCWRPELNLSFNNAAVGGSTCREVMARFNDGIAQLKPDWIFLTIGGNDCRREIPVDEFTATFRDYAARVATWGGHVVFLVDRLAAPQASAKPDAIIAKTPLYFSALIDLATECKNVICINPFKGLVQKAELLHQQSECHNVHSDGNHYNNLGSMILAGEVLKEIGVVT